jgi:hypothetical protein
LIGLIDDMLGHPAVEIHTAIRFPIDMAHSHRTSTTVC